MAAPRPLLDDARIRAEQMHLYLAEALDEGESDTEEDEQIELERWTRDDVEARLGELQDAKTLAGLLLYLRECR